MKITTLFLTFLVVGNLMAKDEISIFHYNIKELDSTKLIKTNEQIKAVEEIVKNFNFDLLSLNEIQYDFPNVPNTSYKSKGENLKKIQTLLGLENLTFISFDPANTGLNAKPDSNGEYFIKPNSPRAREHADQINFGTLPGQYSSGLLSKYKIVDKKVISKIKWKEFNPKIDLTKFSTASGDKYPEDTELFDKNFSDITISFNSKELHLIILHTVPSFHFGNMKTPNYQRNKDQLRFLEWYLTGSTDIKVNLPSIKPLEKDSYFIATGDWNTAFSSTENPGSEILRRLDIKAKFWKDPKSFSFTNEGDGFSKSPLRLMLDYILISKNIDILEAKIIHPKFNRTQLGCKKKPTNTTNDQVLVSWTEKKKTCYALVSPEDKLFKAASDHYPLYGRFELK